MKLVLDLNENESKEFHQYIQWLDYEIPELDKATIKVKQRLANLIYKVYRKKI